jgi:hypothetical protein
VGVFQAVSVFSFLFEIEWGYTTLDYAIFSGIMANIPLVRELLKLKDTKYDDREGIIKDAEQILATQSSTTIQSNFDLQRESWYARVRGIGKIKIYWAVITEDIAMANHILKEGKVDMAHCRNLDMWEIGGLTLNLAVQSRKLDIVKTMVTMYLKWGNLNVNSVSQPLQYTTLHWAVVSGEGENIEMVTELFKCKDTMRMSEECGRGQTPLQIAHEKGFKDIHKALMEQEPVRRYVEQLYRDRQVNVDAANTILVGATLIASVTFASWLQPPMGYTNGYANLQESIGLRAFWVFNSLSFYFAIATVVFGARSVLPRNPYFIKRSVQKLRTNLLATSVLLACSVFFVIIAFGIAGCIVLTPIVKFQLYMIVPTIFGGSMCLISLGFLFKSMWEDTLGKEKLANGKYEWSKYTSF